MGSELLLLSLVVASPGPAMPVALILSKKKMPAALANVLLLDFTCKSDVIYYAVIIIFTDLVISKT